MSVQAQTEAFFLPSPSPAGGQRFCIYHRAAGNTVRGQLLYIHPLAEEMNKSRRMAAVQARALAAAGYAVLQIDLLGCGDSSGDFGDATWSAWIDDVVAACQWLRSQPAPGKEVAPDEPAPLWLWGLRAGCLLAVDAARKLAEPCHFLFWAPAPAGKPLLQQFLRLKVAGDMLAGNAKGVMDGLRARLAMGNAVEIAGYALSPGLASGLEQADLSPPGPPGPPNSPARVEWLELSTRDPAAATLAPVAAQAQARWQQAGYSVGSHLVTGPSFWQTAELEDAPALISATIAAITGRSA